MTVFMRGDLQNGIGGGVENGIARANMLRAEFFENGRAAARVIADEVNVCFALDCAHEFVGKSFEDGKRFLENDARDFPMARGRILAGGRVPASGQSWRDVFFLRLARHPEAGPGLTSRDSAAQSCGNRLEDVPERVRSFIAVLAASGAFPMPTLSRTMSSARTTYSPIGCQAVFISTVSRIQYGFSAALVDHSSGVSSRRTYRFTL